MIECQTITHKWSFIFSVDGSSLRAKGESAIGMSCQSSAVAVKRLTNTVRACKGNRGEIKYRHCLVRIDPVCKIPILSSRDPGRVLRGSGCLVGLHGIVLLVVLVLHAAGNLKVSCEFRNKLCVVGFFFNLHVCVWHPCLFHRSSLFSEGSILESSVQTLPADSDSVALVVF